MKRTTVQRNTDGESTVQDVIVVDDGVLTHMQMERRNGKTFMRAKKRELAVSR